MIISIAVAFKNGVWTCCEDFESTEEGVLYTKRRIVERGFHMNRATSIVTAPLRATGLAMAADISNALRREFGVH